MGTRAPPQHLAEAQPETRPGQESTGPSTLAECLLCSAGAVFTCDGLRARASILNEVKPPTGEPDAGKPPVRFGGRGSDKLSLPLSGLFIVSGGTGFAIMAYKH